ncbi:alpha/beta hydrolase family protein [Alicyclobacillus cycloheptanicus]|uniref:Pimeloyl-ACP methyl ester carboxylesterase n=1 Tax=Alicyclobacillus cycloheptanicus TaxID=1457 RepID=A0ABT9XHS3_9BACL|nr:alpha/beta fold hydrolase [Alicyclobacillus cycloheptanicus]MDQ0189862.1 pimeloyl-ACP methyl ester carboxylesterase [Alicyclobacillus cycloheptanicus]
MTQKAIERIHQGRILRGTEHVPAGPGPFPAVVLYHGFTATRIEPHRLFVKICRRLEQLGIASFRFDFSGSGESDGDFEEVTISGEIAEAHAILDGVLADARVDRSRVALAGLSMGGLIASQVAGDRPSDVHKLVLMAAAGGNVQEIVSGLLRESGADVHAPAAAYDYQGNWVSRALLEDLCTFDVYPRAQAYKGPVLIVHGRADEVVPSETAEAYQTQAYFGRAQVRCIEGANHTFDRAEWESALIDELVGFLKPAD